MKAVRSSIVRSSQANPVILLRPTPSFLSGHFLNSSKISRYKNVQYKSETYFVLRRQSQVAKRIEIPGPRVKYLPGLFFLKIFCYLKKNFSHENGSVGNKKSGCSSSVFGQQIWKNIRKNELEKGQKTIISFLYVHTLCIVFYKFLI